MHPIFLTIGRLNIHWYGVMMALAFVVGLLNWTVLSRKEGRNLNLFSDMLFWLMVSGIVGARAAYVVSEFDYFRTRPLEILRIDKGGLIYYGGFLGAVAGMILFARNRGERFWSLSDLVVTSLPIGHALGRIGCLLNGCCYGAPCEGGPAIRYPLGSEPWFDQAKALAGKFTDFLHTLAAAPPGPWDAAASSYLGPLLQLRERSLPVYPVQLYEAAANAILYALLACAYRHRRREGRVTALYFLGYGVIRFCVEPLRGDARMAWGGLSVAQWVSVSVFLAGACMWVSRRPRPVEAP
jgi:phosphatidylglycerol---prolipoprotein diacylglyceryl transferase